MITLGPAAVVSNALAPSVEFEAVSFAYPDGTRALEEVRLRIEPGESVGVVGQNGSGKSTLVRHLNGLLRPTAGRVLLDGLDIRGVHVAGMAERVRLVGGTVEVGPDVSGGTTVRVALLRRTGAEVVR